MGITFILVLFITAIGFAMHHERRIALRKKIYLANKKAALAGEIVSLESATFTGRSYYLGEMGRLIVTQLSIKREDQSTLAFIFRGKLPKDYRPGVKVLIWHDKPPENMIFAPGTKDILQIQLKI